jgi:FkbM family methyltransferase
MTANEMNYNPLLTHYIIKEKILGKDNFFLIDVGASGGIDPCWNAFGSYLHGVGFDPLLNECNRLNSINRHANFNYFPCYIISENEEIDQYRTPETVKFHETVTMFARSSGWDAMQRLKLDYCKEVFNKNNEVIYSNNKTSLDRYCSENSVKSVNFIKIDTDGFDYSVLRGAEKLLKDNNTLGVLIECDMNAPFHPCSNSFRNIDLFLTEQGFRLFDLSVWRYTKSALPGKFVYGIPAQTHSGQVSWGDALYFRDFVDMKEKNQEILPIQIIKMACVQEIFGFPDCAAELLLTFKDSLSPIMNVELGLNLLTKDMNLHETYENHMTQFKTNMNSFLPPVAKTPRPITMKAILKKILNVFK